MITQDLISEVLDAQRKFFVSKKTDQRRDILDKIPIEKGKATVVTGMRKCGKCTLLLQMQKEKDYKNVVYLNFEDISLAGFGAEDIPTLINVITQNRTKAVFFDEVHIVPQWELLVQQLLELKIAVFISDTNAQLRDLPFVRSIELFPFSYHEYLNFSHQEVCLDSFLRYMKIGGIPKIVRNEGTSIMNNLLDDIVVRDIAVRQGIRQVDALRQLAVWLLSHTGTNISANQLTGCFGIKSCASITEFIKLFCQSYIMDLIPLYNLNEKIRSRNPKRCYALDLGLIHLIEGPATALSKGTALTVQQQQLENLVYIHLRRTYRDIAYFSQKGLGECHFVALKEGAAVEAVHVCRYMSEYDKYLVHQSMAKILPRLGLDQVTVVTLEQDQRFAYKDNLLRIVPAYSWLWSGRTECD